MLSVPGTLLQPVQIFAYFNEYSSLPFLFVPLLLIVLLPSGLVIAFAVRVARRIRWLSLAMRDADLEGPVAVPDDPARDEIGELTLQFQAMTDALRSQYARVRRMQEARRTLVANLLHDLRTPLTSILGYAETLQRSDYDDGRDVNRFANIIVQRARYMDRLLDHLFEVSLLDQLGRMLATRPCNICILVEQVLVDYALILEDRQIVLDLDIPSQPVWLEVNEWSIERVIRNLVDNAIDYGSEGGYLGVRVTETPEVVLIAVSDRGKGIPPEEQAHIFEPFYRVARARRSGGIGAGLALAREIVTWHQGQISVEGEPFVSTVFTIALPKRATNRTAVTAVAGGMQDY